MIRLEDDGYWIEHTVLIAAHPEVVFGCFTTGVGLSRWFPVAANVDLQQGGLIELGWDEKMTRTTTIAIIDFDPGGKIIWDWQVSQSDTHAPLYWTVEPQVEEGAKVTMRQGPFSKDEVSLVSMAEEAQFWTWNLCNLRTNLEAKHDMRKVRPL